jgi:murein DD-endopeptidase MepM/ murein hydrolase activator NlpD
VAACLIDNKNNHTYGINLPGPNGTRRHAERVAIDNHLKRHGRIGPNAIMVTTLSPCVHDMDERHGESCTDLLADYGIEKCYAGWQDPTQHPVTDYPFNLQVTDNTDIFNSCRDIAASFLPGAMVEAFDQPYKTKSEKSEYGDVDMLAKLPDGTYLSIMFNQEDDENDTWGVEFYRNNSQEVTGEGDAQRIFATVLAAIQKFIKKHKPQKLFFSASKEVEPGQNSESRAKLYDRLVQRYARDWGYRAFRADTGALVRYEFSRIKPAVAEGKLVESAIFLNPNTVIVGQQHGRPLELSPKILKKVQAIAAQHGAWYEGNGTDQGYTKGQIDRYVGSWDDEVAKTANSNDPKWLYVLFANVDENNRVQQVGIDPNDTIFNRLLDTAKDNSFQGIGYTSQALQKFLQIASEGKYDFLKMSQRPATQKNLTRFLKAGEALMWPSNWEQYPNKAGKIAKAATVDVRDQYLATRKAGVYVVGAGHLKAVKNILGKQDMAEGNLTTLQNKERPAMRFNEFKLTENSKVTIKRVQQLLLDLGYNLGPTGVDGIVGPYTQSAIDAHMSKAGPQGQVAPQKDKPSTSYTMPVNGRLTSAFGNRKAPVPGTTTNHPGVDIAVPTGTPVRSPIAGKVEYASMDNNACGGTIAISNGKEKHRFCHCSKIDVTVGQTIQQGDVIGLTGGGARDPGRGLSTGPHLHWEKYIAGNLVDPMSNIG